jgi:hypothetical protein
VAGADARIGTVLVQAGLIDELQLRSAQSHQQKWGGRMARILVELGFTREDRLADALSAAFGAPRVKLATLSPDRDALGKLDAAFCEQRNVFPCAVRENGKVLFVAVDDPTDLELLDGIGLRADVPRVKPVVAGFDEIQVAILRWYRGERILQRQRDSSTTIDLNGDPPTDPRGQAMARAAPPVAAAASGPASGLASVQDTLDDLLGLAPTELTPDDLQRLASVRSAQERGVKVLRAVLSLCSEKGVFGIEEYRARFRR